jgi:competence protein ComEA
VELFNVLKYIKKSKGLDRLLILITLLGVTVTVSSFFRGILMDRKVQVEYLENGKTSSNELGKSIFVDIEGGVIKSGVYELKENSRLKDVLVMAGGFAENADRKFCEKNLNMAEIIKDGQKIYIPLLDDTNTTSGYIEANSNSKKVSINSASVSELDTLWGIGAARAEAIVKNRPYTSIDDLVAKGVLTKSLVDRNREMMSLY